MNDDNSLDDNSLDDNSLDDNSLDDNSLDDSFIENIKDLELNYKEFYKNKNSNVNLFFVYIGNSEVECLHKSKQMLSQGSKLLKDNINSIVKTHQSINKTKYKLISLLQYNLTLEPDELLDMMNDDTMNDGGQYLHVIRRIDDIYFENTINFLQDLNALFFVFSRDYKNDTKHKRNTKRIIFNSKYSKSKTRRKKLKDST